MKTDDKDREGGDSHGAIGAKLMEYALKVRKVFVTGGVDEKMARTSSSSCTSSPRSATIRSTCSSIPRVATSSPAT